MKLLGERILVKLEASEGKIELLSTTIIEQTITGEVVAIGNKVAEGSGCEDIEIGDIVQWNAHAGTWTKIEGEGRVVLRMNDVICVLEKEPVTLVGTIKNQFSNQVTN